jgi:DNA replication protein DnaC
MGVRKVFDRATLNKLREMKLSAMAEKLAWQMERPDMQSLSFEERFGMIVDAEWLKKRERRENRLIRQADFRFPAAVEDIDYSCKRGVTKADILRLSDGSFVKRKQNLILSGPTGVGKTFIACAIGRCVCQHGQAARYIRASDLFLAIEEARSSASFLSFKRTLLCVPLLIIDDWGTKPLTLVEGHELLEIVELRYGRASTLISGQMPYESWHELFPDPTVAEAVLDRLIYNAYKFNLSGESMRKTLALRQFDGEVAEYGS